MKECRLERYAQAGAVPGRGAVVGRRMPPADWWAASTVGPPGAARNWGTTEERGESVVRVNEDEDGKSAVAADVVLLDRLQWVGGSPARC